MWPEFLLFCSHWVLRPSPIRLLSGSPLPLCSAVLNLLEFPRLENWVIFAASRQWKKNAWFTHLLCRLCRWYCSYEIHISDNVTAYGSATNATKSWLGPSVNCCCTAARPKMPIRANVCVCACFCRCCAFNSCALVCGQVFHAITAFLPSSWASAMGWLCCGRALGFVNYSHFFCVHVICQSSCRSVLPISTMTWLAPHLLALHSVWVQFCAMRENRKSLKHFSLQAHELEQKLVWLLDKLQYVTLWSNLRAFCTHPFSLFFSGGKKGEEGPGCGKHLTRFRDYSNP